MTKHKNEKAFYERMNDLAQSKKSTIKESRTLGTLIDVKRAENGVAYGIVKENHNYYIKKGGLNENLNVSDFAYIGGLSNITEFQYDKFGIADKNRNMLLATVNEGLTKVSKNGSKKEMLTEDKAGKEIGDAESKLGDLDAATAAADAPAPAPVDDGGEAEMAAGVEDMPVDGMGGEVPVDGAEPALDGEMPADDMGGEPALDGEEGLEGEPALDGEEGGGEEVAVEDETTREIEKNLGRLTNDLRKTELTEPQVKSYVNTFLSAFKDDFPEIDIEDRKEMAERITKVVPPEDIEDLGQNVEDTDGDIPNPEEMTGEEEMAEETCAECGGFAQYAESRGYNAESIMECGEEEMTNLVSGYANAHGEGQNDGDFKVVALMITPEILEKLKSEYGHDDFAGEVEPFANEMNETTEEDKIAQINELFGGLGHMAKKAASGIKQGAQNAASGIKQGAQNAVQGVKDKVGQVGQDIADKSSQVAQGVQNAATNVKQSYHAGEKNAALGKLEKVAANLGKQIAAVNAQATKAGQEPINVKSILSTISNQVGGQTGAADLSKFRTNEEGIPIDHTEVQPMMEEEEPIEEDVTIKVAEKKGKALSPDNVPTKKMKEGEELEGDDVEAIEPEGSEGEENVLDLTKREEPELDMKAGFESMGGGVVKPDGAETTTVEIKRDSVNVVMNEAIDKMNEMLDELSTGLAQKAGQMSRDKSNQGYNAGNELDGEVRGQQARGMEQYVNPQIKAELSKIGAQPFSTPNGMGINVKVEGGAVSLEVTENGYKITHGDSSKINSNVQRRLLRVIEMIKQDLVQPKDANELEEGQMNESELKLRKYIRNRLEEKAGVKKPSLNENKKSETIKKLDKVIDKQFNLFESIVLEKTKKK